VMVCNGGYETRAVIASQHDWIESIQVLSHFLSVVVKNIIHDSCELYHQERILKKSLNSTFASSMMIRS
jgi:hypothetical protein